MIWKFPLYEIKESINWSKIEAEYDWFADMKNVPQHLIWHAEGDVFIHTKMVTNSLINMPEYQNLSEQEQHILFTSALLHDVEKRSTTVKESIAGVETYISPKHAKKGEFTARKILYKDIQTPFAIREQICKLVRHHGLPLWAWEKPNPQKEVIKASLILDTKLLAILAKADVLGRICKDQEELLTRIDLFQELCQENNCWGKPKEFASDYARYVYLSKKDSFPEYIPYDDREFEVVMMSGVAGSGKDTYIANHYDLPIVSLDNIRREHNFDPADKKKTPMTIEIAKQEVKQYLRTKQSFVFNATNITRSLRNKWLSLFHDYGAKVNIIYLEVPFARLLLQNKNRRHIVPENIIHKMINNLEIPNYDEAQEVKFITY